MFKQTREWEAQAYLVLRARALLVRVRLQPHVLADVVLVRTAPENANRSSFLEPSLRLSRACLGKTIIQNI
eukprot:COSAG06_NODE_11802_length_1462_cov_18.158232_2_plen_71_part_00